MRRSEEEDDEDDEDEDEDEDEWDEEDEDEWDEEEEDEEEEEEEEQEAVVPAKRRKTNQIAVPSVKYRREYKHVVAGNVPCHRMPA